MFQAMIRDDGGKRVSLVRCNFSFLPFPMRPLPAEVQRAMRTVANEESGKAKMMFSRQGLLRGWFGLVPFAMFMVGMRVVPYFGGQGLFNTYFWVIAPLMLGLAFYVGAMIAPLMLPDSVRIACARVAVFAGCCGSCGSSLLDSPNKEDRKCQCSECGAVWTRNNP